MSRFKLIRHRVIPSSFFVWLHRLAAVELTLSCLLLAIALVAAGTLAQAHLGTFEAQKKYFDSWWLTTEIAGRSVPLFPGGLTVGALWMINLIAAFVTRFRPVRKDLGIFMSHAGLILLLGGQFVSQWLGRETQMALRVGESGNYSENAREGELALINASHPDFDEVTRIPESLLAHKKEILPPRLPFSLIVHRYFRNAQLNMAGRGEAGVATHGIGSRITAVDMPAVSTDDAPHNAAALIELNQGTVRLGTWLVSVGLGAPQSVRVGGSTYALQMRPRRVYYPFTLTLKEFRHDLYPGTDIPKNFSSRVQLTHPGKNESRDALIYMNHPLRYEGKTFYQASFGKGDTLSVFQVVDNPAAVAPYVSCALVALGLLIQFLSHAFAFARKRS